AVLIQPDGKIVVAGEVSLSGGSTYDFALWRFNANGSLDADFGTGGRITTDFANGSDRANAAALQSDGKIVLAGFTSNLIGSTDFALARYVTAASSAQVSGRVTAPDGRPIRNAFVSLIDPQGVPRTVTTSSFGFYSFDNVPTGVTYVIRVSAKRYRFAARNLTVNDNMTDVDFVASE
ncbi:MAG: carboxypeptidase regulatory-like domain-containing protein, partial [Pyrinomonadaceae bacterium]